MSGKRPELTLLPGRRALDADALARMYEKLTGRKPSAEELERAKAKLLAAAAAVEPVRPCPFCAHDAPSAAMIDGEPPVYVIACTECGATGPKSAGELKDAVDAWNQRFGLQ